jgi:hypothetical protein
VRPVLAWPHPGHGRADATTSLPGALGAPGLIRRRKRPSVSRLHPSPVVGQALLSRPVVGQGFHSLTSSCLRVHPQRLHPETTTSSARFSSSAPRRVSRDSAARSVHFPRAGGTLRRDGVPRAVSSLPHPDMVGGWRGDDTHGVETTTMDVSEILTFVAFGIVVLCVLAWRRGY